MLVKHNLSVEEFDEWVYLPENINRDFEYIGGKIVEVVSNGVSSCIGAYIGGVLSVFVKRKNLGWVTGADGGYVVMGQRYIPDVAFISKARQAAESTAGYNPIPPDLAVEVLSPSNSAENVQEKVENYLKANVLVWVVDPDRQEVDVYEPHGVKKTLTVNDTLDGGNVLNGFKLPVKDIF